MKIIFVGRDTAFNRGIVSWLANDHDVAACLFVENELFTPKGVLKRIRTRDFALLETYAKDFEKDDVSCPSYDIHNVNAPEWIDFVRAQQADIILSVCTTVRSGRNCCRRRDSARSSCTTESPLSTKGFTPSCGRS